MWIILNKGDKLHNLSPLNEPPAELPGAAWANYASLHRVIS